MKNVFITGAAGSLGHTLANQMIQAHWRVLGFVMPFENDDLLDQQVIRVKGDVLDLESLHQAFKLLGPHGTVVHCAGMISIDPKVSRKIYEVNVEGTKNIIQLCQAYHVDQLIYVSSVHALTELKKGALIVESKDISSDYVVGHYSKSKATATRYLMDLMDQGFPATIVYPSGIISDEDVKNAFMTQMVKDYCEHRLKIGIQGGYDFVDVRDVASAIVTIATQRIINEHYILSNQYYTVMKLMKMLYDLTNIKKVRWQVPVALVKLVLPIKLASDQRHQRISLYTADSLKILNSNAHFSHRKAELALNYHPRDIKETFKLLIARLGVDPVV